MKRVLILTSSPQPNGSSNTMAKVFEQSLTLKGALVKRIDMTNVRGSGCSACMACRKSAERCVVVDQIGELLDELHTIDILVMAAPVWWMDLPVAMRRFVERWYSLVDSNFQTRLPPGKRSVLLLSQGEGEMSFLELADRYREMLEWLGFAEVHILRHCSSDENSIFESGVLPQVEQLAQRII